MAQISVFDMLKIGIGPSSSHTLGPWRAAQRFARELDKGDMLPRVARVSVALYGSLALTGRGHGTDIAILLGLSGADPVDIPLDQVQGIPVAIRETRSLSLGGSHALEFDEGRDLLFHDTEALPYHANGMVFQAVDSGGELLMESTFYSVGGGFVVTEGEAESDAIRETPLPYPIDTANDLKQHCARENLAIWEVVMANECQWRQAGKVREKLLGIWKVMEASLYNGCHRHGELPGGLHVVRRAASINRNLIGDARYDDSTGWIDALKSLDCRFSTILKWISAFAMAVNEENANFGRIVTAPTNGAAGVIPAALLYLICFSGEEVGEEGIVRFLLVAGEIGCIFKKGATISAAMGGCQAEIGVSSAMAAAALTESLGGTVEQSLMAAEIAMEHHLGLTCDPVGGLVQVPCIERNSMGAVKAITAANLALEGDPGKAKVSLDDVVDTMWEIAQEMSTKYKETSQGGLAVRIPIQLPEC